MVSKPSERKVFIMVTEIKEKEVMTLDQLMKKYATKWIMYEIEGEVNEEDPEANMCYAVYVADTEEEFYEHPYPNCTKVNGGWTTGYSYVFPMEIGGIYSRAKV